MRVDTPGRDTARRYFSLAAAGLAFILSGSLPALADEAEVDRQINNLLGNHEVFRQTISEFQQAVSEEDTYAVSAFIEYPITVKINGKKRTIKSAEAFQPLYYDIITPEIAEVIVNQDYGSLFVNSEGVMFGNGEVWMSGICRDNGCNQVDAMVITIQSMD
ncbi:hypothetical protein [Rhizobium sp. RU36D]|uniref:hypothetical protein n=1 Tax=Rhizobium sp. RU36D TaxID=1907415 RepID=UPI0009D8E7DA|nr:hypothetical protein [Rhizobium sp. RU36D]SMD16792.1 hypothetical protein SAMN05880593_13065 [Rhizobium sp. RU36D]